MTDSDFEILQHGRWSYGSVRGHVWIVQQSYDFYHEDFYDEAPQLDRNGKAYYVLSGLSSDVREHSSRSRTCLSRDEAMLVASETLKAVDWD
jgi:hypothetical protein